MKKLENYFDKTKFMYFMIKDEQFLNKYIKNWGKGSNIRKDKFNREIIHNKKYLKAKKN